MFVSLMTLPFANKPRNYLVSDVSKVSIIIRFFDLTDTELGLVLRVK